MKVRMRTTPLYGILLLVLTATIGFGFGFGGTSNAAGGEEPAKAAASASSADLGAAMTESAQEFLASLTPEQRKIVVLAYDDPQRTDWHWIPKPRKGLTLGAMTAEQRPKALALVEKALSPLGYAKFRTITRLESVLGIQEKDDSGRRDPEKYHFTIFGKPDAQGTWGWSAEGHHFSVNCVISGGKLVAATPMFMGANPRYMHVDVKNGPKVGTEPLAEEEALAFALVKRLDDGQKAKMLQAEGPPKVVVTGPPTDTYAGAPVGLAARDMTPEQREVLQKLVAAYTNRITPAVGNALLAEIADAGWGNVHFAWFGAADRDQNHHYRIQGPTFVIHFDNTQADPIGKPANHIHSMFRSLTHDFGGKNP